VIARSNHAACHSFFTVRRVGIVAARRSTALRLTRIARTTSKSSAMPGFLSPCCGVATGTTRAGRVTFVPAMDRGALKLRSGFRVQGLSYETVYP
jgi:hypothetical protein